MEDWLKCQISHLVKYRQFSLRVYDTSRVSLKVHSLSVLAMHLHYGDLTDSTCLVKIISQVRPSEIYNLGAQSHVKVSKLGLNQWPCSLSLD